MGWGNGARSTVKLLFQQLSVFILSPTTNERVDESSSSYSSFMQPVLFRTLQLPRNKLNTNGQSASVFHFKRHTNTHVKQTFHCVNIKKINKYQPLCGLQHLSKCVSPSVIVPCLCVCLYVCIPRIFFRLSSPKTHLLLSLKLCLQGCAVYTDVCLISVHSSYLLYLCEPVCVCGGCASPKKPHIC